MQSAEISVLKNVMLPGLKLAKYAEKEVEQRAYEKLKILGIENEALKWPNQLSGGQKQRCSIARALIVGPKILVADEPTGNLDRATGESIMMLFKRLAAEHGVAILLTTHNTALGSEADRAITMEDGRIVKEEQLTDKAADRPRRSGLEHTPIRSVI